MPVNFGGKRYDRKKHMVDKDHGDFPWADDSQLYGRVEQMLGNSRVRVVCSDAVERTATIRGNMRKRTWISPGDIVLLSLREFTEESESKAARADVLYKYSPPQIRHLRRVGELSTLDTHNKEAEDPDLLLVFDEAEDVDLDQI